jgi:hypothetical protein
MMSLETLLQTMTKTGGTSGTPGTHLPFVRCSVPPDKKPSVTPGTRTAPIIPSVPGVPAHIKSSDTPEVAPVVSMPGVPLVPAKNEETEDKSEANKSDYSILAVMPPDDRRYCRQCKSFSQKPDAVYRGYCSALREHQHDDIPRRCDHFQDYGLQPPLGRLEERDIREWLEHISEIDIELIEETLQRCRDDVDARVYFLKRADEIGGENLRKPELQARTCQEC